MRDDGHDLVHIPWVVFLFTFDIVYVILYVNTA
jgi:hypothetical protein